MLVKHPGRHAEDVALVPVEPLAADHRPAAALGDLIDDASGVAVRARPLARTQHLHRRADRLHDVAAGQRIDVAHHHAVERRTVGDARIARQRTRRSAPTRISAAASGPCAHAASTGCSARRAEDPAGVVDGMRDLLREIRMHLEEIRLQRVDQRDVQPVLPDADAAGGIATPCSCHVPFGVSTKSLRPSVTLWPSTTV